MNDSPLEESANCSLYVRECANGPPCVDVSPLPERVNGTSAEKCINVPPLEECVNHSPLKNALMSHCVAPWKSFYERFHFNPLKCMAEVNVQCKKDWCVEI